MTLNLQKGFFRVWALLSLLWITLIIIFAWVDISEVSISVYPWMENSCKGEYSDNNSTGFINCVEQIAQKVFFNRVETLLYEFVAAALILPATTFFIGFALIHLHKNDLHKKSYNLISKIISILLFPIHWIIEGFQYKK